MKKNTVQTTKIDPRDDLIAKIGRHFTYINLNHYSTAELTQLNTIRESFFAPIQFSTNIQTLRTAMHGRMASIQYTRQLIQPFLKLPQLNEELAYYLPDTVLAIILHYQLDKKYMPLATTLELLPESCIKILNAAQEVFLLAGQGNKLLEQQLFMIACHAPGLLATLPKGMATSKSASICKTLQKQLDTSSNPDAATLESAILTDLGIKEKDLVFAQPAVKIDAPCFYSDAHKKIPNEMATYFPHMMQLNWSLATKVKLAENYRHFFQAITPTTDLSALKARLENNAFNQDQQTHVYALLGIKKPKPPIKEYILDAALMIAYHYALHTVLTPKSGVDAIADQCLSLITIDFSIKKNISLPLVFSENDKKRKYACYQKIFQEPTLLNEKWSNLSALEKHIETSSQITSNSTIIRADDDTTTGYINTIARHFHAINLQIYSEQEIMQLSLIRGSFFANIQYTTQMQGLQKALGAAITSAENAQYLVKKFLKITNFTEQNIGYYLPDTTLAIILYYQSDKKYIYAPDNLENTPQACIRVLNAASEASLIVDSENKALEQQAFMIAWYVPGLLAKLPKETKNKIQRIFPLLQKKLDTSSNPDAAALESAILADLNIKEKDLLFSEPEKRVYELFSDTKSTYTPHLMQLNWLSAKKGELTQIHQKFFKSITSTDIFAKLKTISLTTQQQATLRSMLGIKNALAVETYILDAALMILYDYELDTLITPPLDKDALVAQCQSLITTYCYITDHIAISSIFNKNNTARQKACHQKIFQDPSLIINNNRKWTDLSELEQHLEQNNSLKESQERAYTYDDTTNDIINKIGRHFHSITLKTHYTNQEIIYFGLIREEFFKIVVYSTDINQLKEKLSASISLLNLNYIEIIKQILKKETLEENPVNYIPDVILALLVFYEIKPTDPLPQSIDELAKLCIRVLNVACEIQKGLPAVAMQIAVEYPQVWDALKKEDKNQESFELIGEMIATLSAPQDNETQFEAKDDNDDDDLVLIESTKDRSVSIFTPEQIAKFITVALPIVKTGDKRVLMPQLIYLYEHHYDLFYHYRGDMRNKPKLTKLLYKTAQLYDKQTDDTVPAKYPALKGAFFTAMILVKKNLKFYQLTGRATKDFFGQVYELFNLYPNALPSLVAKCSLAQVKEIVRYAEEYKNLLQDQESKMDELMLAFADKNVRRIKKDELGLTRHKWMGRFKDKALQRELLAIYIKYRSIIQEYITAKNARKSNESTKDQILLASSVFRHIFDTLMLSADNDQQNFVFKLALNYPEVAKRIGRQDDLVKMYSVAAVVGQTMKIEFTDPRTPFYLTLFFIIPTPILDDADNITQIQKLLTDQTLGLKFDDVLQLFEGIKKNNSYKAKIILAKITTATTPKIRCQIFAQILNCSLVYDIPTLIDFVLEHDDIAWKDTDGLLEVISEFKDREDETILTPAARNMPAPNNPLIPQLTREVSDYIQQYTKEKTPIRAQCERQKSTIVALLLKRGAQVRPYINEEIVEHNLAQVFGELIQAEEEFGVFYRDNYLYAHENSAAIKENFYMFALYNKGLLKNMDWKSLSSFMQLIGLFNAGADFYQQRTTTQTQQQLLQILTYLNNEIPLPAGLEAAVRDLRPYALALQIMYISLKYKDVALSEPLFANLSYSKTLALISADEQVDQRAYELNMDAQEYQQEKNNLFTIEFNNPGSLRKLALGGKAKTVALDDLSDLDNITQQIVELTASNVPGDTVTLRNNSDSVPEAIVYNGSNEFILMVETTLFYGDAFKQYLSLNHNIKEPQALAHLFGLSEAAKESIWSRLPVYATIQGKDCLFNTQTLLQLAAVFNVAYAIDDTLIDILLKYQQQDLHAGYPEYVFEKCKALLLKQIDAFEFISLVSAKNDGALMQFDAINQFRETLLAYEKNLKENIFNESQVRYFARLLKMDHIDTVSFDDLMTFVAKKHPDTPLLQMLNRLLYALCPISEFMDFIAANKNDMDQTVALSQKSEESIGTANLKELYDPNDQTVIDYIKTMSGNAHATTFDEPWIVPALVETGDYFQCTEQIRETMRKGTKNEKLYILKAATAAYNFVNNNTAWRNAKKATYKNKGMFAHIRHLPEKAELKNSFAKLSMNDRKKALWLMQRNIGFAQLIRPLHNDLTKHYDTAMGMEADIRKQCNNDPDKLFNFYNSSQYIDLVHYDARSKQLPLIGSGSRFLNSIEKKLAIESLSTTQKQTIMAIYFDAYVDSALSALFFNPQKDDRFKGNLADYLEQEKSNYSSADETVDTDGSRSIFKDTRSAFVLISYHAVTGRKSFDANDTNTKTFEKIYDNIMNDDFKYVSLYEKYQLIDYLNHFAYFLKDEGYSLNLITQIKDKFPKASATLDDMLSGDYTADENTIVKQYFPLFDLLVFMGKNNCNKSTLIDILTNDRSNFTTIAGHILNQTFMSDNEKLAIITQLYKHQDKINYQNSTLVDALIISGQYPLMYTHYHDLKEAIDKRFEHLLKRSILHHNSRKESIQTVINLLHVFYDENTICGMYKDSQQFDHMIMALYYFPVLSRAYCTKHPHEKSTLGRKYNDFIYHRTLLERRAKLTVEDLDKVFFVILSIQDTSTDTHDLSWFIAKHEEIVQEASTTKIDDIVKEKIKQKNLTLKNVLLALELKIENLEQIDQKQLNAIITIYLDYEELGRTIIANYIADKTHDKPYERIINAEKIANKDAQTLELILKFEKISPYLDVYSAKELSGYYADSSSELTAIGLFARTPLHHDLLFYFIMLKAKKLNTEDSFQKLRNMSEDLPSQIEILSVIARGLATTELENDAPSDDIKRALIIIYQSALPQVMKDELYAKLKTINASFHCEAQMPLGVLCTALSYDKYKEYLKEQQAETIHLLPTNQQEMQAYMEAGEKLALYSQGYEKELLGEARDYYSNHTLMVTAIYKYPKAMEKLMALYAAPEAIAFDLRHKVIAADAKVSELINTLYLKPNGIHYTHAQFQNLFYIAVFAPNVIAKITDGPKEDKLIATHAPIFEDKFTLESLDKYLEVYWHTLNELSQNLDYLKGMGDAKSMQGMLLPFLWVYSAYPSACTLYVKDYMHLINTYEVVTKFELTPEYIINDDLFEFALQHRDILNYIDDTSQLHYMRNYSQQLLLALNLSASTHDDLLILSLLFFKVTQTSLTTSMDLQQSLNYANALKMIQHSTLKPDDQKELNTAICAALQSSKPINEANLHSLETLVAWVNDLNPVVEILDHDKAKAVLFYRAFYPNLVPYSIDTQGYHEDVSSQRLTLNNLDELAGATTQLMSQVLGAQHQTDAHIVDVLISYNRSFNKSAFADVVFETVKQWIANEISPADYCKNILAAKDLPCQDKEAKDALLLLINNNYMQLANEKNEKNIKFNEINKNNTIGLFVEKSTLDRIRAQFNDANYIKDQYKAIGISSDNHEVDKFIKHIRYACQPTNATHTATEKLIMLDVLFEYDLLQTVDYYLSTPDIQNAYFKETYQALKANHEQMRAQLEKQVKINLNVIKEALDELMQSSLVSSTGLAAQPHNTGAQLDSLLKALKEKISDYDFVVSLFQAQSIDFTTGYSLKMLLASKKSNLNPGDSTYTLPQKTFMVDLAYQHEIFNLIHGYRFKQNISANEFHAKVLQLKNEHQANLSRIQPVVKTANLQIFHAAVIEEGDYGDDGGYGRSEVIINNTATASENLSALASGLALTSNMATMSAPQSYYSSSSSSSSSSTTNSADIPLYYQYN